MSEEGEWFWDQSVDIQSYLDEVSIGHLFFGRRGQLIITYRVYHLKIIFRFLFI